MNVTDFFNTNRYVYLSDVIPKEKCMELTNYIFSLKNQGKMTKDEQCPKSWSIYGDPVLDEILKNLAGPLSNIIGTELLPTYTYCRIYEPGEILKRHIDRESCEISGTLTLGYDPESEIWPIFFTKDSNDLAGNHIAIDTGDMVLYRGNELIHWRPEYIGKWQVQVFFHFVDANGKHKEWIFDKRQNIGISESVKEDKSFNKDFSLLKDDDYSPQYAVYYSKFHPDLTFTKEECAKIIDIAKKSYFSKSTVGNNVYNPEVRRVDNYSVSMIESNKWIYEKILRAVTKANNEYYNFEIKGITHEIQLLHYKETDQGFYDWHVDIGDKQTASRKLSISIMLSDENDYEGGDLIINNNGIEVKSIKEKGSINMFPSYMLHTVTPVTKGNRWVLVVWIHGNQRFR